MKHLLIGVIFLLSTQTGCRFLRIERNSGADPGSVSASESYDLNRNQLGTSSSTQTSKSYKTTSSFGLPIGGQETISDSYHITNSLNEEVR